jgi:hypothetical protein
MASPYCWRAVESEPDAVVDADTTSPRHARRAETILIQLTRHRKAEYLYLVTTDGRDLPETSARRVIRRCDECKSGEEIFLPRHQMRGYTDPPAIRTDLLPDHIARQKRLLHKVIRAVLIS